MKSPNIYPEEGRMLLDAYRLSLNTETKEISLTQQRTALVHYNGTNAAYGEDCEGCVTIGDPVWTVQNAVAITIEMENNYDDGNEYIAYDLRAVFVQEDTDGTDDFLYDQFEIVSPMCDSTDIPAPGTDTEPNPDPDAATDFDRTNPFYSFYKTGWYGGPPVFYDESDRVLLPGDDCDQTFILAVNDGNAPPSDGDDFRDMLIMIDVCYWPANLDYDYPNCPEPYAIRFEQGGGEFITVDENDDVDVDLYIYDHQCDRGEGDNSYTNDIDGDIYFFDEDISDISADFGSPTVDYKAFFPGPGAEYTFNIDPDGNDLDAGLYEGVIVIEDDESTKTLKRKIWVTVEKDPTDIDDVEITDIEYGASSPVRADLDGANGFETYFTTDGRLWGIGSGWGSGNDYVDIYTEAGCFVGVPTIVDDMDDDNVGDILLAFASDASWDNYVCAVSGDDGSLIWTSKYKCWLGTKPVSHPVMVDVDGVDDDPVILVICKGGKNFYDEDSPGLVLIDYDGNILTSDCGPDEEDPHYYGKPAILEGASTTYAFVVRMEGLSCYLEAWDLEDLSAADSTVTLTGFGISSIPLSPTIDYSDAADTYYIYVPTYTHINMAEWDGEDLYNPTPTALPDVLSEEGRVVLGDMNRDGEQDVVITYSGGIAVYTGYVASPSLRLNLMWSYEDPVAFTGTYSPPVLMDCNGDAFLDIIAGVSVSGVGDPEYRLMILDGSPYNNHNRQDSTDRVLWTWGPADTNLWGGTQSPVLAESSVDTLELRMVFLDKPSGDDALYQALDTLYGSHDESYQCDPWLKAYYSLSNWNNVEEDGAPYD